MNTDMKINISERQYRELDRDGLKALVRTQIEYFLTIEELINEVKGDIAAEKLAESTAAVEAEAEEEAIAETDDTPTV